MQVVHSSVRNTDAMAVAWVLDPGDGDLDLEIHGCGCGCSCGCDCGCGCGCGCGASCACSDGADDVISDDPGEEEDADFVDCDPGDEPGLAPDPVVLPPYQEAEPESPWS